MTTVTLVGGSPMVGLELICFGPPTARVADLAPPPEVLWRKHLALLIYLALSPDRTRARQHLLGLLWPERDEAAARHSLNEAVRRLRGCLGPDRILSQGELLTLNDSGLRVDALEFGVEAAANPGRAAGLLRGDFLEGFVVSEAPAFEEWATRERERYRAAGGALLVREGERCLLDSRLADAQDVARRALALEPYSEPAARLLMRAAALSGDATGALAAYHAFRARVQADLQEGPSRELGALAERIRHDRWRDVAVRQAHATPVVGRAGPHRTARSVIADALASKPQVLIIAGESGSGRTRLLSDCADRLALDGAVVAVARPLESDHDAPWSTLRALVRAGLSTAPGVAATAPDALSVLSAIVPELAQRAAPREPRDRAEVVSALGRMLRAVADEGPVALAVDDAQFADGPSVGALHAALEGLEGGPVILIITTPHAARVGEPELLALRAATGRSVSGATVRLESFSLEEMSELVRSCAPWCHDEHAAGRLTRRLAFETAGNPLLAVTLLRALQDNVTLRQDVLSWPVSGATLDSPLPISVPALARMAVIARVTRLDEASQRVLAVASVLGSALEPELIGQLAGSSAASIEDLLPPMEALDLLAFDGQRYTFAAALVAEVVRSEFLTPGQRRTVQRRAAGLLASRADLESRVLRAELLARVEPGGPAFSEATAVARDALAAGARRTASRALTAAGRAVGAEDAAGAEELEELRTRLRAVAARPQLGG